MVEKVLVQEPQMETLQVKRCEKDKKEVKQDPWINRKTGKDSLTWNLLEG